MQKGNLCHRMVKHRGQRKKGVAMKMAHELLATPPLYFTTL
eukprot:13366.XXX_412749_412871_1 [CDS] Oithona nana genome sequencing.